MAERSYDVIVLGVGGMGSAAVYELARRGRRVLGLEQFTLGHSQGSSHGQTRIIRKAYYEHPDYVPLVCRAFERWYDLEQRSGKHLLTECGCLSIGRPDSELIQGVIASAREHRLPIEYLTCADIRRRFAPFRFDDDYVGVLENSAGFLGVEQCVLTHAEAAIKLGADIHVEEPAVSWQANNGAVSVQTARAKYHAARLIITAGPWSGQLLERFGARLSLMRQVALWFAASEVAAFRRDRFPLYIGDTPAGIFYGFPLVDAADGIKVAEHYGAPELANPEEVDRTVGPADEENVRRFLRAHLPAVDGPLRRGSVCIYTLTPDRHFLIDRHPDHANVSIAAGFSGHGFKFASVVGEVLSDLADNGRTDLPIGMFQLSRFAEKRILN